MSPSFRQIQDFICVLLSLVILAGCQDDAPPSIDDEIDRAQKAMLDRRDDEALEIMRALVSSQPDDPRIQRIYGEALIATGQHSLAVWPLSRAMQDPEQATDAGLLLTSAQLQIGSGQDAITTASKVIAIAPEDPRGYSLRARAYLVQNLEEESIADLDRAVELGLDDHTIGFVRLYALLGLGKLEEAESLMDELHAEAVKNIDRNPRQAAEMCAATALFASEAGNRKLAEERFDACLDGDGLRNDSLVSRAVKFYDGENKFDQGTEVLRRRFEADEINLSYRVAYADRLRRKRAFGEAEALLLEATKTQPAVWAALVDHHSRQEDFEKALEALEHALATNPYAPDSWRLSRSDYLIILGRLDEAQASLKDLKLETHRAVIEGRLLVARGELEAGAKRFEEALVLWPDNPDLRYLTGNTYERLGDWLKAASHFREAARVEPPHYLSSRALVDIMHAVGDQQGRGFVLFRMLSVDPNNADLLEETLDFARSLPDQTALANSLFQRLSRLPGMQGRAVRLIAQARSEREGVNAALNVIDTAGVDFSTRPYFEALEARTRYLGELGRRDEALAQLDEILSQRAAQDAQRAAEKDLEADPPRVLTQRNAHTRRLLVLRGDLRLEAGRIDDAGADFDHARTLDPKSVDVTLGLARVAEARGEVGTARSLLNDAVGLERERRRNKAEASIALAAFELRDANTQKAKDILRAIIASQPRNGAAALLLSQALVRESGVDKPSEELIDVARRAALFERGPETRQLIAELGFKGKEAVELLSR